jgi:uroporphyrin-III C-methyltransferase/precorrin-2 dehydrogenase/sirohydrochlorin ferrochelatase
LYDDAVSPAILEFARREARKMLIGSDHASLAASLAQTGRRVVRLVGRDPHSTANPAITARHPG